MNRLIFSVLLLIFLLVPASAAEEDDPASTAEPVPTETVSADATEDDKNIIVNVNLPAASTADTAADDVPDTSAEEDTAEPGYTPYTLYALDAPAESADTPALQEALEALFGTYTPRTQTVTEYLSDGSSVTYTQVVPGIAGLDWSWIASVGLFALVLYALLRMVGGLLK